MSDNASPLSSAEAAVSLGEEYGIEVRRNLGNVGVNANIALGFVFVRAGEYLWILSDDDTVGEGTLRTIATEGLVGDPDVVTFDSKATRPTTVAHTWLEGWDWIGEAGLISNVIYKADVFAPQASQAFFYHNSSFPHLAVLLATMRERGSLSFRVVPSSWVLLPRASHTENPGDYSISLSGMPQLASLLPHDAAARFCRLWLREHGPGYVKFRGSHPDIHMATRAVLRKYGGRRAMIKLRWLMIAQPLVTGLKRTPFGAQRVTRLLPETLRRRLRKYL